MDTTKQPASVAPEASSPVTPPVAEPAAMPPSATMPAPAKKKKQLMLAIIVAAVLVLAGAAYGVYAYVTNTPDYLLSRATAQFAEDSKSAMAARFKITNGTSSTGVTFSGDLAYRSESNQKNGEVVVGIGSGTSRVTVNVRVIDDIMYLKFGSLGNFGNLVKSFGGSSASSSAYDSPEFKAAMDRVNDKWFSLTKEELQSISQSTGGTTTVSDSVTPEELQKVLDIYNKHKVLQVDKTFADEQVDSVNSAHFTLKVNKDELKAFLTDVKNANLKSFKITDEEIENAVKETNTFAKDGALEVWVARDSKKLKQVKLSSTEAGSEGSFAVTFVTDLPKFDKLEKPADSKPFSEFMNELLGPAYSSMYEPQLPSDYDYYYDDSDLVQ